MADGGDIIIRGGSCDLIFDDSMYPADPRDPGSHKNKDNQKVTRVMITGDISYDSGDHPSGLHCDITVTCK
jgi:hypothetical protein